VTLVITSVTHRALLPPAVVHVPFDDVMAAAL
jgi:hypothetical protein